MNDMIDRHDLDALGYEYVGLYQKNLMQFKKSREQRLKEIESIVGKFVASEWSRRAEGIEEI